MYVHILYYIYIHSHTYMYMFMGYILYSMPSVNHLGYKLYSSVCQKLEEHGNWTFSGVIMKS